MNCGIIHGDGFGGPKDEHGCHLPVNHGGQPHEFIATDGRTYQWETDLECDCEHCMQADGDYCTTYWPVASSTAAQAATQPAEGT